jgi:hypothetical protein
MNMIKFGKFSKPSFVGLLPIKMLSTVAVIVAAGILGTASEGQAISLSGWSTNGNSGVVGADGDVPLSPFPGSTQYGWVSTAQGVNGVGLGLGSERAGSTITSPIFAANAGDALEFFFNYVTSDGSGFADYAWAQLLDASLNQVASLFTARTTPGGDTVPGFGMPALNSALVPALTPIQNGQTTWSPLGVNSTACFSGVGNGCGNTGWIKASYKIASAGNYALRFGVVNWSDNNFQSGLAFDGATISGVDIGNGGANPIPTPALLPGLIGLGAAAYRKRKGAAAAQA